MIMALLRQSRSLIALVAVTAALSWLLAANHCAALTLTMASDSHACCHQETPEVPVGCCKALNVPLPDTVKLPAAAVFPLAQWLVSVEWVCFPAASLTGAPALNAAAAPPLALSFAEMVLSGILSAHAPPSVVS